MQPRFRSGDSPRPARQSAEPAQSSEEQAKQADRYRCLHQHCAVESCFKGRNLGTQIRLRRESLDINARSIVLSRLPQGIRECVGLLVGEASTGQATSNRVSIEHEVMLPRSYQAPGEGDERPSQVGPSGTCYRLRPFADGAYGPLEAVSRRGKWRGKRKRSEGVKCYFPICC